MLSSEEQLAALEALDRLMFSRYGSNQTTAAMELGIAQQNISEALRKRKIGRGLASAVARACGMTLEQLVAVRADPWPNRTLAIPLAKEDGATVQGIADTLAEPYDRSPDRSRVWWALRMKERSKKAS
jgi:hypothetical protein